MRRMSLVRAALVLGLGLGCGPGPAPARPAPAVGRVVHYRPLELARDARQPGQAVILGTDDTGGSTVLAIPVAATIVVVYPPAVGRAGELPAVVLTSAARGPGPGAPADAARPGGPVEVGGAGEADAAAARWRAGVWSAALAAATALGKDLGDLALEATPAGPIDATASALVGGGLLAALIGDTIDPAATLSGAIQPDGAIGPVAGLPEQLAAAIAHGKARFGYPAGMRIARSVSGADVDLVQLAREHRVEAIELAALPDAYQLLTGHRLPVPVPVAAAAMALDPATLERLGATYTAWQQRLAGEWAPLLQLEQAGRLPAVVAAMVQVAHDRRGRAEADHRAGKLAAAHGEMRAAWLDAAAANQTHAVVARLATGDVDGAVTTLAALDGGDAALRAVFGKLGELRPQTLAAHLAALDALDAALRAWASREHAGDALRAAGQLLGELHGKPAAELGAPALADAMAAAIAPAVQSALRAVADATIAEQALEAPAAEPGVACRCAPGSLARVTTGLAGAAAAAVGELDALIVAPMAQALGVPDDVARRRAGAIEPDYALADLPRSAAVGLPHELATAWGDDAPATGLLALATARAAYHAAARLIARRESLGVRADDAGRIAAIEHPQALRRMLATAERSARAAAHAAQIATGAIPAQARLAYQLAAGDAAGDLGDQLNALAGLWAATAVSETAVALARGCDAAAPP